MLRELFSYRKTQKTLIFAYSFCAVSFLLAEFLIDPKIDRMPISQNSIEIKKKRGGEIAFTSSLFLKGTSLPIMPFDLKDELFIYSFPQRPDIQEDQKKITVKLKSSGEKKDILVGQEVYLSADSNHFHFSEEKTPFLFQLIEDKENTYLVETLIGKEKLENNNYTLSSMKPFDIKIAEELTSQTLDYLKHEAFALFSTAKWFGPDLLMDNRKQRVEIVPNESLNLDKTQFLVYIDNMWKVASQDINTQDYPIMRIGDVKEQTLKLEGWDIGKEGYYCVFLCLEKGKGVLLKPANWIEAVHTRTNTKVSCQVEKKCMVLKQGDWVVKKKDKWHALKTQKQRELFLISKEPEELFVFDGMKEVQGKDQMVIRLFNPSRTEMKTMMFPSSTPLRTKSNRAKGTSLVKKKGKTL